MSYDISFWKQRKGFKMNPEAVYQKFCKGEAVDQLEKLPVADILTELRTLFPAINPKEKVPLVRTEAGSIEFTWSPHHFRFDSWGDNEHHLHRIVRLMRKFGCPLYDPQLRRRYGLKDRNPFAPAEPEGRYVRSVRDDIYDAISADDDLATAIRKMKQMRKGAVASGKQTKSNGGRRLTRTQRAPPSNRRGP